MQQSCRRGDMNTADLFSEYDIHHYIVLFLVLSAPGVLLGVLLGALLRQAAYGILRPFTRLFRLLTRPVRALLRFAGFKAIAKSRPARIAMIGGGGTLIGSRPDHLTETEWALRKPDEPAQTAEDGEQVEAQSLYNFHEEEKILRKDGAIFKWFRIPGTYIPKALSDTFTNEIADQYAVEARKFFNRQVQLKVNEKSLYEDAEGAVIIDMFRNSDRRCYYALNQLRKTINNNALRLIILLSFLLVVFAALSFAFPFVWSWILSMFNGEKAALSGAVGSAARVIWAILAAIVLTFLAILSQSFYANQQRQNMREFSDFLTRYLGLVSNRFREASASASRVIQGDERDSKKLAANAQKWQKIMMWLAFRPFFIESFVRNVDFQLRRNLNYYLWGGFVSLIIVSVVSLAAFAWFSSSAGAAPDLFLLITLAFGVILCIVSIFLMFQEVVTVELDQLNWLGFDNLEVAKQMDEVIGKYAEDIGQWKGRFDR